MYCFVQCRSDSTRFPDKALYPVYDIPLIKRVYEICRSIVDNTIVIIPYGDRKLIDYFRKEYIPYFEGDKEDVLKRYYDAALTYKAKHIIRITADCPFVSPAELLYGIHTYMNKGVDFCSNVFEPRNSIDGNDYEIMNIKALTVLHQKAESKNDREHITTYFYRNMNDLGLSYYGIALPLNLSSIKSSIDTPEDIENLKVKGYI